MTTKYAIIGAGMMGQEHIRNIQLLPGCEVVGIAEPDADMRSKASSLIPGAHDVCADHKSLLAKTKADILVVASPNFTHADVLEDIVPAGRAILVEKPLVTDLDQARRVEELGASAQAPIWVGMEYRYIPGISNLIADVHAGAVGDLRMLSIVERRFPFLVKVGDWNRFNRFTGGTLVEKCCHFFDLMRLISQAEPLRVSAIGGHGVNHGDERYDGETPDILDHAYVTVEFEGGIRALLELCMFAEGSRIQERVTAIGNEGLREARVPGPGRFEADGVALPSEYAQATRTTKETSEEIEVDRALSIAGDHHGSTYFQHQAFRRMMDEGGEPEVTLADGIKAVKIGMAAQQSIATGVTVEMSELSS